MHSFREYAPNADTQVIELVRRNPFAAVISVDDGVPIATHVPLITPPSQPLREGGTLWGHMAGVNPQWRSFDPDRPVLVIFTGAHAYVSGSIYEQVPAVPTWNYSAAHITALPQLVPEGNETMQVLTETVRAVEGLREHPWDMSTSLQRFHQIAGGVVAFTLRVVTIQSMFKLSQEKPDEVWQRVHDRLDAEPVTAPVARDMAALRPGRRRRLAGT
jgi:transcriptional regulator